METTERVSTAPIPSPFGNTEEHFVNCKGCGHPMMTTYYQLHLIAACPEWSAASVEEVRKILICSGVHYLFEVNKGFCEYCSKHFDGE